MGLQENFRIEPVCQLKIREAATVTISTVVRDVVKLMRDVNTGCAIVIDEGRKPIGIFTESMVTEILANKLSALDETMEKQMAQRCPWVRPSDPIADVLDSMQLKNIRMLCVVDEQDQVAGLTGQRGLMEYVAEHFPAQGRVQRICSREGRNQKTVDAELDPNDFQDLVENDEPRHYDDPLERALVEEALESIRHEPFTTISPTTPVHAAVETMAELHIACLLVADHEKLVGVFSDRDVVSKLAFELDGLKDQPVRDVMTTDPIFVHETDSAIAALSVMAQCGCRHVPVLDLNDNLVGVISPQRVTEFLQRHFQQE